MFDFAICEINKKQYKVLPNKELLVDFQDSAKEIAANVLLLVKDGKIQVGKPYLKEKITLKVMENVKADKIRVSKFHAKANYRKTTGSRRNLTRVILDVKKS